MSEKKIINDIKKPKSKIVSKPIEVDQVDQSFNNLFLKKDNKVKKKSYKYSYIFLIILIISIFIVVYYINKTFVYITKVENTKNINQTITLSSWNEPFNVRVITFKADQVINDNKDIESAQNKIKDKINNQIHYDLPKGYEIFPKCRSNIYYTRNENIVEGQDQINTVVNGSLSLLAFESTGLMDYLNKNSLPEEHSIKEIKNLSCDIKSNLSSYLLNSNAKNLSFILNVELVHIPNIDHIILTNSLVGSSKKNAKAILSNDTRIQDFKIKLLPFNFFPVLSNKTNKINIIFQN